MYQIVIIIIIIKFILSLIFIIILVSDAVLNADILFPLEMAVLDLYMEMDLRPGAVPRGGIMKKKRKKRLKSEPLPPPPPLLARHCALPRQTPWRRPCLTLKRLGYFGGWKDWGAMMAPPWDLGRGLGDRRENLHNGSVRCNLQDRIYLDFPK